MTKTQLLTVARLARINGDLGNTKEEIQASIEEACKDEAVAARVAKYSAKYNTPKPEPKEEPKMTTQAGAADFFSQAINSMITEQLASVEDKMMAKVDAIQPRERVIIVKGKERKELPEEEIVHPKFEEAMDYLSAGMNVMLVGPAGSGKTHMARQLARALGVSFSATAITLATNKSDILGQMLPTEAGGAFKYHRAPFTTAWEEGGLHLWDEADKFDPNLRAMGNMALSNGILPLAMRTDNPMAHRHEDFYMVATANTWGTGSDGMYAGSVRQDAASNDRFFYIYVDYDNNFEKLRIDETVLAWGNKFRDALKKNGMPRFLSTRQLLNFTTMYQRKPKVYDLKWMHAQATAGWKPDEIAKVKGAIA